MNKSTRMASNTGKELWNEMRVLMMEKNVLNSQLRLLDELFSDNGS